MSVGHIYTQHILPLLRVLTPSPVKGANTSRLVMRTRSENVCETTSAEPATKQKKHYCDYVREWRPGHRSSPTLTQPRQGKARVPVIPVLPGSGGKLPIPRGKAQQRLTPRPSSGMARSRGTTAKQKGRKADKKKGKGQKEVWKGNKKPPCGPEPPPPPVLNAALGPAASGTRETTTSFLVPRECAGACQETAIWGLRRMETQLHL